MLWSPSHPTNGKGLARRLGDELRAIRNCGITVNMPPVSGNGKQSAIEELEWVRDLQMGSYDDLLMMYCISSSSNPHVCYDALPMPRSYMP